MFLENILMLSFWAFIGTEVAIFCRNSQIKTEEKKNLLLPVVFIMGAIILGLVINMISGGTNKEDFGGAGWSSFDTEVMTASSEEEDVTDSRAGRILRSNDVTTAFRGKRWYDGAGSIVSQVQECISTKGKSVEELYSSDEVSDGYEIIMAIIGVVFSGLKKTKKALYWGVAAAVDYFAFTRFHVSLHWIILLTGFMGLVAYGVINIRSSRQSSSSSSGGTSFGGGSFGGGGSSGGW